MHSAYHDLYVDHPKQRKGSPALYVGLVVALIVFASSPACLCAQTDLFPADRVLEVNIVLADKDWDTLRHQSRDFMSALSAERKTGVVNNPYTYVNASIVINGNHYPNVKIRKKGFLGSQSSTRPSLKVKLNSDDKDAKLAGLTNLTFNNNKQDRTLLSQYLAYRMFNDAGSPAPKCSFAYITVNGKNLGVYSHVEAMRKTFPEREFGTREGTLYEGTVVDFFTGWEAAFERKFGPDTTGRAKIQAISKLLTPSDNEISAEQIAEHVDLDAFYTFWAVESLIGSWDGYSANSNNFFVYLHPANNKLHFIPWGADAAYEKHSKINYDRRAPISVKLKGLVGFQLYQSDAGKERFADTLRGLLRDHWNETEMLAEVDRVEEMLLPHLCDSQSDSAHSIDRIRKFIGERREQLEAEIADGMPPWDKVPDSPFIMSEELAKQKRDWNKGDGDKAVRFVNAAKHGKMEFVKAYLTKGGDIEAKSAGGVTALLMASLAGQSTVTQALIEKGADVNTTSDDGGTPLHVASFFAHPEVVKQLLAAGADINAKNVRGEQPMSSVDMPWTAELEGIYRFVAKLVDIEIDLPRIKNERTTVATLLREHRSQSDEPVTKE